MLQTLSIRVMDKEDIFPEIYLLLQSRSTELYESAKKFLKAKPFFLTGIQKLKSTQMQLFWLWNALKVKI